MDGCDQQKAVPQTESLGQGTEGHLTVQSLWTAKDAARFLRKSVRWLFYALRVPSTEPGSIPHVKLGRSPRFDPLTIAAWVSAGCPPAAVFASWQEAERRKRQAR